MKNVKGFVMVMIGIALGVLMQLGGMSILSFEYWGVYFLVLAAIMISEFRTNGSD